MPPLQETDHSTFGLLFSNKRLLSDEVHQLYYYYNGLMIYYTVPKRLCKQSRHKYRFTLIKLKLLYCPPSLKINHTTTEIVTPRQNLLKMTGLVC